ncbi:MAG: hypothetical protein ACXADU_17495 [Promethearchaeota archaeon]
MPTTDPKLLQAREELIQYALDKVRNVPVYEDFSTNSFCVIANFGLQLKAKEEALFDNIEWIEREETVNKIEIFLRKHIK